MIPHIFVAGSGLRYCIIMEMMAHKSEVAKSPDWLSVRSAHQSHLGHVPCGTCFCATTLAGVAPIWYV
jgi:hypothetical protein